MLLNEAIEAKNPYCVAGKSITWWLKIEFCLLTPESKSHFYHLLDGLGESSPTLSLSFSICNKGCGDDDNFSSLIEFLYKGDDTVSFRCSLNSPAYHSLFPEDLFHLSYYLVFVVILLGNPWTRV